MRNNRLFPPLCSSWPFNKVPQSTFHKCQCSNRPLAGDKPLKPYRYGRLWACVFSFSECHRQAIVSQYVDRWWDWVAIKHQIKNKHWTCTRWAAMSQLAAESQFCLYVYMGITIVLKQPLFQNQVPKIFKFQSSVSDLKSCLHVYKKKPRGQRFMFTGELAQQISSA